MAFCKTITHVVQPGDTFYRLAQRYQTTVPEIILRNPGVNPYNLQIGTRLNICAGQNQNTVQQDEMALNNDMRKGWMRHNYWARMYQTSLYNNLKDLDAVGNELMMVPEEIADVFGKFYPQSTVNQIEQLLKEHTRLTGEVMKATQNPETPGNENLERQWYQNAEQIARALSDINTEYSYDEILKHLTEHLDLMKRQMLTSLNGEYDREIALFNENESHLMALADYLTSGLIHQFYRK